jgi:hypothetical protein
VCPKKKITSKASDEDIRDFKPSFSRRAAEHWVRACPNCFSRRLQAQTNIAGFISNEEWFCKRCGYSGIAIEVHIDDLEKMEQEKYRRNIKR